MPMVASVKHVKLLWAPTTRVLSQLGFGVLRVLKVLGQFRQ